MFEQLGPVWQNFSVPDPDLEIRGVGAVIQILRKGGGGGASLQKNFFCPFGPQFRLNIRREAQAPSGPSPGSATYFA